MAEALLDPIQGGDVAGGGERLERRAKIASLQSFMENLDEGQKLSIDDITFHHFASGVSIIH